MSTENKTKQELAVELLSAYKSKDDEVNRIRGLLDKALLERSEAVKQISKEFGKGPFTFKGEYLGKIVARNETFFFRGKSDDGMKID